MLLFVNNAVTLFISKAISVSYALSMYPIAIFVLSTKQTVPSAVTSVIIFITPFHPLNACSAVKTLPIARNVDSNSKLQS